MADPRIGRAVLDIVIDDKEFKLALGDIEKNTDNAAKGVASIGQAVNLAIFKEFAEVAGGAIKSVIEGVVALGMRGAEVSDVAGSFEVLTAKAGETAGLMLGQLREGVKGTLTDFELMQLANKTLGTGLVKSSEDMGTLAAGARTLAKATGGTTKEAFETLTSAMASGRTAQLKQLGIFVDSKVAIDNYTKATGKAKDALTDADRAQALSAESLAALRQRLKEIPPDAADFGELIEAGRAKLLNFRDALAVSISQSPVFRAGMLAMGDAIVKAFGPHQTEIIDFVTRAIESLAIFAVDVAKVVVGAARFIANGFQGLKVLFNEVMSVIFQGVDQAALLIRRMAEAASDLPGVGEEFKKLAGAMNTVHDFASSMVVGFEETKNKALDTAASINSGFDKVQGVLTTVKTAMVAAQGAARETATTTTTAMGAMAQGAETAGARTSEAARKIADVFRDLEAQIVIGTMVGIDKRLAELDLAREKELEGYRNLKGMTAAEYDLIVQMVSEKYAQMAAAAKLGYDEVRDGAAKLQQDIILAESTGQQQRLLQIEFARQKEIEGLAFLSLHYGTEYSKRVALVNEKSAQMIAAEMGFFATVEQAAAAAGFKTRAELEQTAAVALATYQRMKESGLFTAKQIQEAHEKAEVAKREAIGKTQAYTMTAGQALQTGALQVLDVLGQKHKAAAIAGAIIATYLAVSKALASAPWPASLALAAGALAAGMANVNRIRSSQPGYREGTPGLDFVNFGRMSLQPLHGSEAIIPSGSGHLLAQEIASAMETGGAYSSAFERLHEIADGIAALPHEMKRAFRDGLLQATS